MFVSFILCQSRGWQIFSLWGKRVWTCWTCCDQRAVCWEHFSSCAIEFVSSYTCWLIVCSFVLGSVYFAFHFIVGHDGDLLVGKPVLPPFEQIVCMFLRRQIILLQTDSSRPWAGALCYSSVLLLLKIIVLFMLITYCKAHKSGVYCVHRVLH